jgi:NAD(P)-dependent dehydrogenase (short-subunit alcohol dehydrogenase family)
MTALVVGASRGLGRGIATSLAAAGTPVVAVGRSFATDLPGVVSELADAADPAVPAVLLDRHDPAVVVLVAGAAPPMRPLHQQTWETFSVNWHADVRIAFQWLREVLLRPLRPGGRVIVVSSGAALAGSPLSGGYAGAKATQRFITAYAQEEATRAGLDLTFTTVLPKLTPLTDLGRPAFQAYAARAGHTEEQHLRDLGAPLTPDIAGAAIRTLAAAPTLAPTYLLTAAGLRELP